ncbi:hypothetical protein ACVDG8_026925 [Mesorhizobium sp. ORM8.1]
MASEADLATISKTILELATPEMSPKELMRAARGEHPEASRKDVVRAAFYAIIANTGSEPSKLAAVHDFALKERAAAETGNSSRKSKSRGEETAGS